VIILALETRLSALEVLRNICNMGTHDLPDMHVRSPQALGIHIRQITCAHVTTIKYAVNKLVQLEQNLDKSLQTSPCAGAL